MGQTLSPETSAFKLQTPGKFPEEYKLQECHANSLVALELWWLQVLFFHSVLGAPNTGISLKRA